ncbi:MAG: pyruvate, phosphate dikinase [Lentisphaerae bacterium]|nr:pyruvate, phosphate dikinase [Lentisphaerota bacterium]
MTKKYVYTFGGNCTEGEGSMKNLLGGKGANLAEMANLGLPVPPGFTVTTECCVDYFKNDNKLPGGVEEQVKSALTHIENVMGMKFGDPENPLLVSCRSGARSSMPGMMETVLNVGLSSSTLPGLIAKTGNERFVYDAYRRLIMMYSDVVMEKAEGIEPAEGKAIRRQLDAIMDAHKKQCGYQDDTELTVDDLKYLCEVFKKQIKTTLGTEFPDDPMAQLWGGIGAVLKSWNGKKAVAYRRIEGIPDDWGTAVNVQSMVFGNMGDTSATGVAFTRDPATGDNKFYGEWLINAQGEDVVAGTRTPNPLNKDTCNEQNKHLKSMEELYPALYKELFAIRNKLEAHYHDMLDIEFTIQEGKLFMLQCRVGKRTGTAAVTMAIDMLDEKLIDEKTAVCRVSPSQLDELLHPILDIHEEKVAHERGDIIAKGLPAGPGGAVGKIVFSSEEVIEAAAKGESVILVREETNPEDVEGMRGAVGILTARGGMTSHAALVCRGWGKCCIVGAGSLIIDEINGTLKASGKTFKRGDFLSLNGSRGYVYQGALATMDSSENKMFQRFMALADKYRKLGVRANADTPEDAKVARSFGAEGIGLFRTEHMFYGKNSEKPLFYLRKMILANSAAEREVAITELFPYMKASVKDTLLAMDGMPVTFRLLDPPLHEFVPNETSKRKELASALGIDPMEIAKRAEALHESNPMMGHRGVRLGITYPEVACAQMRAILEAAVEVGNCVPEIMIPVTCDVSELRFKKAMLEEVANDVAKRYDLKKIDYKIGSMIEIPRAALLADQMAEVAEFFSFGTNDLTQMTFGFSRDDIGSFLPDYLRKKLLDADPFQTIDTRGVGRLIEFAVQGGRATRPELKIGICGEQGGDPKSVAFCHAVGLNYVSCSPFRVPLARLAAAQAAIEQDK